MKESSKEPVAKTVVDEVEVHADRLDGPDWDPEPYTTLYYRDTNQEKPPNGTQTKK